MGIIIVLWIWLGSVVLTVAAASAKNRTVWAWLIASMLWGVLALIAVCAVPVRASE